MCSVKTLCGQIVQYLVTIYILQLTHSDNKMISRGMTFAVAMELMKCHLTLLPSELSAYASTGSLCCGCLLWKGRDFRRISLGIPVSHLGLETTPAMPQSEQVH